MKNTIKSFSLLLLCAFMAMALIACNKSEDESKEKKEDKSEATKVVTIKNDGTSTEYNEAPKRAISLNQHVTEVMLSLGLEDSMVGSAYLDDEILPELKKAYDKVPVLSDKYPSKEQVLEAEADFLYAGWSSAFTEKTIGTREELKELGINTYIQESSSMNKPTIENVYKDIENIGRIFQVEDRATEFIDEMKAKMKETQDKLPKKDEKLKVFVLDSGDKDLYTAAQNFANELITLAGGVNIFNDIEKGWVTVSKEDTVERNPDVIVVVDYGDVTAEQKINFMKNDPALKTISAVQNNRFVVVPLSALAEGVRAPMALETIAKGFYPESFK